MIEPILAAQYTWFRPEDSAILRANITKIIFIDTYEPLGNEIASWDASQELNGSVKAYIVGTELIVAGNGSGKIYTNPDSSYMFRTIESPVDYFPLVETIEGLELLDTSKTINMANMFANLKGLVKTCVLPVQHFDTSHVVTMFRMFYNNKAGAISGTEYWDVSNCEDMSYMFYNCTNLTILDLHDWNTHKVTTFSSMFGASAGSSGYEQNGTLTDINVSNWDVGFCKSMSSMFSGQGKMASVPIETWKNANECTDMGWMFWGCGRLQSIDLSNFDTSKVISFHHLFAHDGSLKEIRGLSELNVSSAISLNAMLHSTAINELDISKWDTSNVEDFSQFLEYNTKITYIVGLEKINTSKLKACGQMFNGCQRIKELNLSAFNTTQVDGEWKDPYRNAIGMQIAGMFNDMHSLEKIIIGENFSFNGNGTITKGAALLPTPSQQYIPNTKECWYDTNTLEKYSSNDIQKSHNDSNKKYAIYSCAPIQVLIEHTTVIDIIEAVKRITHTTDKLTIKEALNSLNNTIDRLEQELTNLV